MATQKVDEEEAAGIITSDYGQVRVFTRHLKKCPYHGIKKTQHNACRCPKWISDSRNDRKDPRYPLRTLSWDVAVRKAKHILKGYDPEVAEGRKAEAIREKSRTSIEDACKEWMDRTERELGRGGTFKQYQSLMNKLQLWARANDIHSIGEVTTRQLSRWYSSTAWTDLSDNTRSQRWGVLRMVFAHLQGMGMIDENPILPIDKIHPKESLVQGPYTVDQIEKVFRVVKDVSLPGGLGPEESKVYRERVTCFLTLLLHTGCDPIDGALFEPGKIENLTIDGEYVGPVYRYKRVKTGKLAVVPLDEDVAAMLRSIPILISNPAGMPFRTRGLSLPKNAVYWSRQVSRCLKAAVVTEVLLPELDQDGQPRTHPANVKQFRHSFAVRQLSAGQRPEAVAKMLGHADTRMILQHYAPWVQELDEAHAVMVFEQRRKRQ